MQTTLKKHFAIYEWAKKRNEKESMIFFTPKTSQILFVYCKLTKEKKLFKEKSDWRIEQKSEETFLTALSTAITRDPAMPIGKHANELKIHEKTECRPGPLPILLHYVWRLGKPNKYNFPSRYWFA